MSSCPPESLNRTVLLDRIKAAVNKRTITPPEAKFLRRWLAHADDQGRGNPSLSEIRKDLGAVHNSVVRFRRRLRDRGILRPTGEVRDCRGHDTEVLQLTLTPEGEVPPINEIAEIKQLLKRVLEHLELEVPR